MIAVSNTTPLRYLIAIGQDDLLGKLFEKVFVPTGFGIDRVIGAMVVVARKEPDSWFSA